jgi:hypothetical protein
MAEWIPPSVVTDLTPKTQDQAALAVTIAWAPGGVQIAGPSTDVYVRDNEIEGGRLNGVSLGGFELLDTKGAVTSELNGVLPASEGPCAVAASLLMPSTIGSGAAQLQIVAGGPLINIAIEDNRIRDMGLCGVGPVGIWNLAETAEAIGVQNLSIRRNVIERTLQRQVAGKEGLAFSFGAICVPDVVDLSVCDNEISDFGTVPGAAYAAGVYVQFVEFAEISRNRIRETRDWSGATSEDATTRQLRGGIVVAFATPPILSTDSGTLFEPSQSALRVEHNVVRVALGDALAVTGLGPFSIANNHFSTGGGLLLSGFTAAKTVYVLNVGSPVEYVDAANNFSSLIKTRAAAPYARGASVPASRAGGAVLFSNNMCQLEAGLQPGDAGFSSVLVASLDNVLFANNHSWIDAQWSASMPANATATGVYFDAVVLASAVQVTSNRLQEPFGSVMASGVTIGLGNITALNFASNCLYVYAQNAFLEQNVNNVAVYCLGERNDFAVFVKS